MIWGFQQQKWSYTKHFLGTHMGYLADLATFRGFWACLKMGGLNPHAKHMAGESMINHDFHFFFGPDKPR